MDEVKLFEALAEVFGDAIVRKSPIRHQPPSFVEMQVLKVRAKKYARDLSEKLKLPATDPNDIETDIGVRVAMSQVENELTNEQREELRQLIWDESGLAALRLPRAG